jgi:hypothetical protein
MFHFGLVKKSPAAYFGSQGIGTVVIPSELRKSISLLISGQSFVLFVRNAF